MPTNPWEVNYSSDAPVADAGNEPWNENYAPAESPKRSAADIVKDVGVTAVKGAVSLPQAIVGIVDIPAGGRVGKALEDIGYRPNEAQAYLEKQYSPAQQEANRKVHQADGFVDTLDAAIENPSAIVTTVGESIPQMIGGAGVARGLIKGGQAIGKTISPYIAGGAGEGVIGAGSAEESIRAQTTDGLTTPKQSLAALFSGIGTAAFGMLGGKIANRLGLADVNTMLAQGGANGAAASAAKSGFIKQILGSGISEGVFEELPQSIQEQIWMNYATGKPLGDGIGNAAAISLLSGTAMGAAGGGYNAVAGRNVPAPEATPRPAPQPEVIPPPAQKTPATPLGNAAIEAGNQGITLIPDGAIRADELLGTPETQLPDIEIAPNINPAPATAMPPEDPALSKAEVNLRTNTVNKLEDPALEAIISRAQTSPPQTPSAELILNLAVAEMQRRAAQPIQESQPQKGQNVQSNVQQDQNVPAGIAGEDNAVAGVDQGQVTPQQELSEVSNGGITTLNVPGLDQGAASSRSADAQRSNGDDVLRPDATAGTGRDGMPGTVVATDGVSGVSSNAGEQSGNLTPRGAVDTAPTSSPTLSTTSTATLPSNLTGKSTSTQAKTDVLTSANEIPDAIKQNVEALVKLRKNAGQLHLASKLDQAINKAKHVIKTGTGKASDFKGFAKLFKGKDDNIHVALMSIANTLEPVKEAAPKQKRKVALPKVMSMLQFVASIGGLDRSSAAKEFGRLDDMKAHKSGIFGQPAFRVNGGMSWDSVGEALAEAGYLPKNEHGQYDKRDLEDRLNAELSGEPQYKQGDEIDNAEAEKSSRELDELRDEAESLGIDWKKHKTADDLYLAIDAKRFELSDAAEGIAAEALSRESVDTDFDFGTPLSAAQSAAWLEGLDDGQGHQGQVDGTPSRNESEDNQRDTERSSAQGGAERQDASGFELQAQSNEEVIASEDATKKAQQEATKQAKDEQTAKDKADVAARIKKRTDDADNFVFGESSKDAAKPMGSLFNQPATVAAESKPADELAKAKEPTSSNKIFTDSAADEARKILKRKLGQLNSGLDPELMQAGITLAGYHIEKGARTFAAFAKEMIGDLGVAVKPHLKSWYSAIKFDPRAEGFSASMDSMAGIEAFDIDKLNNDSSMEGDNATTSHGEGVPRPDTQSDTDRGASGDRVGEQVDAGLAGESKKTDSEKPVSGRVRVSSEPGAQHPGDSEGLQSPSAARADGSVRPASGTTDNGLDHAITDDDEIGSGGLVSKFRDNVAAIKILKALDAESRAATPQERKELARYVGFGALKGVFDKNNKQWAKQYTELRELLNDEEYDSARASVLNAHYTSKPVVDSMFSAIKRMGFTSGRFLEPSVGSGNFFGMMPSTMSKASTLHGVELDLLTSKLVQAIYPKAKIAIATGFQHYQVPSGYFDIAMGNPPFGSEPIIDRERSEYSGFSIHNYFIARMIDKVRDGGIVPVIVSHNFMDAINPKTREWIAKRANLIAAVRLPNTAFKGNAGTEVVTDILFFQKTATPESSPAWVNASDVSIPASKGGDSARASVNEYFQRNKQNILGKESTAGSMYRANEYTVEPTGNLTKQLAEFVESLPTNIYSPVERTINELDSADNTIPAGVKQGSFFVTEKGEVKQRGQDIAGSQTSTVWVPKNDTAMARMKGMVSLRNLLRTQMRMELDPVTNVKLLEAHRKTFSNAYDEFFKKYGFVNSQVNSSIFMDDTEYALLQAIEFDYDKGVSKATALRNGLEERAPSAKKADILARRVLFPFTEQMNVASANDALLASLDAKGRVDIDYMENVYSKSRDEIVKELGDLLYLDPATDDYVMSDEYLSGDVKTKLATAKKSSDENHAFSRNVAALEKVIPADKLPSEIYASLGAGWMPAKTFEQFATEITGSSNINLTYLAATAQWLGNINDGGDVGKMTSDFGTKDLSSFELLKLTMNGKAPEVKKKIERDGKEVLTTDVEATEAARDKVHKIKQTWESWVWNDGERTEKLAGIFNDKHNRIINREYNGDHLALHGSNPAIVLRKHQKSAVWRGIQDRNMLLDHAVGAGKTFVGAALIMEFKRLGIARKPILVVPNHLTTQWRSEFARMYPAANVLAANPDDFSKANRQRMFSKIALGEYDAVIIGHSSLTKIGLDPVIEEGIHKEQIDEIAKAIEEMKTERGDRGIVRDMEKIKANLEAKVEKLRALSGERDKVVTFDELGIDGMFVDEMHEFKNLFFVTQMQRVSGLGNPKGSGKAFDMFAKVRWLTKTYGEKVPFITATGTPVSNSLSEMYTMQRYMKYDEMKRDGLHLFDSWARMYGDAESLYEVAPSGVGYRISQRFSKFKNLPSLMAHYRTFADTVTLQDLKDQAHEAGNVFPVPKIAGGKPQNIVAQRSDDQRDYFGVPTVRKDEQGNTVFGMDYTTAKIVQNPEGRWILSDGHRSESFETKEDAELGLVEKALTPVLDLDEKSLLGQFANLAQLTRETKGKINALSLTSLASKAGLDMRIIDPDAQDFAGSKINKAVDKMMDTYKQWSKDKGTQLVFCDSSIPLSARTAMGSKDRRLFVLDQGILTHKTGTLHTIEGLEGFPFYLVRSGTKADAKVTIYDPVTGTSIKMDMASKSEAKEWVAEFLSTDANRDNWYEARSAKEPISAEQIAEYRSENDLELAEDGSNEVSMEDIEGVAGASQFSVYDDIKGKLVARGVPDNQIAFIHDYDTPAKKQALFKSMNRGDVRFLFGSTPKLGAGTNVQERLVGLHHIDAPWRPSDLEQREGRIIRQGNILYKRDPSGFEVFVGRYATEQTYDTRRWQLLEHKAAGIEQLRKYSGQIEIEDVAGEAANSADMKAAASGNPLILEETKLRTEVKRLTSLQKAHADGKYSMQLKLSHERNRVQTWLPLRLADIENAIKTANANPAPTGKGLIPSFEIDGKKTTDRDAAEKRISVAVTALRTGFARNHGFRYRGVEFTFDSSKALGALSIESPSGTIASYSETEGVSPSGVLTRLANYVDSLPQRKESVLADLAQAKKDIASIESRLGAPFADLSALSAAQQNHGIIQRKLMKSTQIDAVPEGQRAAFKAEIAERKKALEELGYGNALKELDSDSVARFSKGNPSENNHTVESATTAMLEAHTGKAKGALQAMLDSGKAKVVTSEEAAGVVGEDALLSVAGYNVPDTLIKELGEIHPDVSAFLSIKNDTITLSELQMPKEIRNKGLGSRFMGILTSYADNNGMTITLHAAGDFGGSRAGQERFYKSFDFVANKGRNKDYRISENMIRRPKRDDNIRYSKDGQALAFFNPADNTTYFIADHIPKGYTDKEWEGLILHEVSVHALNLGRDSKEFQDILKQVELMRKAGNKAVIKARESVPEDTAPENILEEQAAYLVQQSPSLGIVQRFISWFKTQVRKLGGTMKGSNKLKLFQWANSLTPNDIVAMAQAALTSAQPQNARGSSGAPMFARGNNNASWDSPEPSTLDNIIYKLQNKNIDLKRVLQAIKSTGAQVTNDFNAYLQEELFHGRAAKRTQDFVNTELRPLIKEMAARNLKIEEIDAYLHARHAKEANALIAQRDPNMQDNGSGMTNQQADDYFTNLPQLKRQQLDAIARRVDAIITKTRDYYVSYDLVSRKQADEWGNMFQHYVPLMREDHDGGMGIGQGFSIRGREVRHRTGSTAAVIDIFANIALQREKAIVRGEKNRVATSLFGLAHLNPNTDFWTAGVIPTERVLNEKTGLVETRAIPMFSSRNNVVVAKIKDRSGNIQERAVVFNEHNERAVRMAEAMKNLDATQLGGLLGVSAVITRYFSSINTQYNPVFGVTNLVRDVQGAALNLTSTPLAKHKAEVLKQILPAAKAIYLDARAVRNGSPATSLLAQLWEELQNEGGMTGFRDLYRNSEDRANAIKHELDPHNWVNNKWGKVFTVNGALKVPMTVAQDLAAPVFNWLSDYNTMMEGSTRLAIYKTAIDNGLTKQEAAGLAKNTTVNFNRKGQSGQQAGALYAFFNAAMQGSARIAETLFSMDNGDIKTLRLNGAGKKIVAGGILLGAMQALALSFAGFDDDEPPEFIRERNLIIPIGGKKYISIPMPLGFHALPNVGRITTEFAMGGLKKPADHLLHLIGVFAEAFNPIGSAGLSMQSITPTALDPLAALAENKDWTGKSIFKEDFSPLSPTPGFTRNKDTASAWSKFIAEAVNYATGGTDYTPGKASPTADQIDYLIGQATGGVGRELSKLEQTGSALVTGEDLPTHKIPLVGRFYGDMENQSSQGGKFYKNLKDINLIEAEWRGRNKDELPTEKFEKNNPEYELIGMANGAEAMVRKLRQRKTNLIKNGEPKEEIREVEERITEVMRNLNDEVRKARTTARP